MLIVTALSAAFLSVLFVMLSLRVVGFRRKHKVSVGDGGEEGLQRAIRAQGNFAEYTPIALILLACLELNGAPWWLCAVLALLFISGRVLHPVGMRDTGNMAMRVKGMQLTLWSMLGLAASNVLWLGWTLTTS